jgi:hypothetical protein
MIVANRYVKVEELHSYPCASRGTLAAWSGKAGGVGNSGKAKPHKAALCGSKLGAVFQSRACASTLAATTDTIRPITTPRVRLSATVRTILFAFQVFDTVQRP